MAVATSVVARISGVVTFTDGSVKSMAATLDESGRVSVNNETENSDAAALVNTQTDALNDNGSGLIDAISPSSTIIDISTASDSFPVVSEFYAEFSGRVSYDDGTSGDFIGQYNNSPITLADGREAHLLAALDVGSLRPLLRSLLAGFTGDESADIELD